MDCAPPAASSSRRRISGELLSMVPPSPASSILVQASPLQRSPIGRERLAATFASVRQQLQTSNLSELEFKGRQPIAKGWDRRLGARTEQQNRRVNMPSRSPIKKPQLKRAGRSIDLYHLEHLPVGALEGVPMARSGVSDLLDDFNLS